MGRLGKKLREHIKQAQKKLDVINICPDDFIDFYRTNLNASDKRNSYFPLEVAIELIDICINSEPKQALIFAAKARRYQRIHLTSLPLTPQYASFGIESGAIIGCRLVARNLIQMLLSSLL